MFQTKKISLESSITCLLYLKKSENIYNKTIWAGYSSGYEGRLEIFCLRAREFKSLSSRFLFFSFFWPNVQHTSHFLS